MVQGIAYLVLVLVVGGAVFYRVQPWLSDVRQGNRFAASLTPALADPDIGLSHLLEHMFFSGSENFPGAERIATEIKELGGQLNAGTYYDSTHYWVVLPAHNINKALEIQADACFGRGSIRRC